MAACYGLIVRRLSYIRTRTSSFRSVVAPGSSKDSKTRFSIKKSISTRPDCERKRVSIMCAVLVTAFVICWFPHQIVQIAMIVGFSVKKASLLFYIL